MKKLLSLILVLFTVSSVAYADTSATEKRNAFEFCNLYLFRAQQMYDVYGYDVRVNPNSSYLYDNTFAMFNNDYVKGRNKYHAQTPAGMILVNVPDFSIESVEITFVDYTKEEEAWDLSIAEAMVAVSALEYSGQDEYFMESWSKFDKTRPKDALDATLNIFDEKLLPAYEKFIDKRPGNHEKVFASTGNYNYYFSHYYLENEDLNKIVLIAEARK